MIRSRSARALSGAVWIGALVAAIVLLHSLGTGPLSTPPVFDRATLRGWLDERDAVVAAFALVRLIGLLLAGYLLLVTVLGLAARLSRVPTLMRAADVATVPAVRRVLGVVAGVSLTATATSIVGADVLPRGPAVVEVGPGAEPPVVLRRLPDASDGSLHRLPAPGPPAEGRATLQVDPDALPPPAEDDTATMRVEGGMDEGAAASGEEWTVGPGDHLWSIAESTLARAWGRAPSDAEVAPYWRAVIEANRSGLVDPANPDLIRPGQVLTLPAPPAPR